MLLYGSFYISLLTKNVKNHTKIDIKALANTKNKIPDFLLCGCDILEIPTNARGIPSNICGIPIINMLNIMGKTLILPGILSLLNITLSNKRTNIIKNNPTISNTKPNFLFFLKFNTPVPTKMIPVNNCANPIFRILIVS